MCYGVRVVVYFLEFLCVLVFVVSIHGFSLLHFHVTSFLCVVTIVVVVVTVIVIVIITVVLCVSMCVVRCGSFCFVD
jgi:hypothetical protein